MCWMCVEQEQSGYRKCDGCNEIKELEQLGKYDIFKRWGELAEFVNQKRVVVFCSACTEDMDKYHKYIVEQKPKMDIVIPKNGVPVSRYIDRSHGTVPVGTHHFTDEVTLGIRCAKMIYGVDAVEEILQGFIYHDDQGHQIRRLTLEDVDEATRCDKCWLPLWRCNAEEVTQ